MISFVKYRPILLTLLSVFAWGITTTGQNVVIFNEGDIGNLSVVPKQGIDYYWEIYSDYNRKSKASTADVLIKSGKNKATIAVDWHKAGTYFYLVTALNTNGCANLKVGKVVVKARSEIIEEEHNIDACPDYAITTWVDKVDIPVLINDSVASGSFDISSLNVTKNPLLGKVIVNSDGTISYSSVVKKSGRDKFVYSICSTNNGCDTALVTVDIYDSPIRIPEALSPNGDGVNEIFAIRGLEHYPNSGLFIYSRAGQLIYENHNYLNNWDGRDSKGHQLVSGTYYYTLQLGENQRKIKGFVYIAY